MLAYQIEINSGDQHPTAPVVALTPRSEVHMKILQKLTDGDGSTFLDSEDAHLTVDMLYQPIATQTRDEQGLVHNGPIDVDVSANTFVCALALFKQIRADVGAEADMTTLNHEHFEIALDKLKTIFEYNFLLNKRLADDLRAKREETRDFSRAEKSHMNKEFREAFNFWLSSLLGDKSFAYALLRHGIFDFSNLSKCAVALRQDATYEGGGISQSATQENDFRKTKLRRFAANARKRERRAKKWAKWAELGWNCTDRQNYQIILLQTGELAEQVRIANAAYGFGKGAEEPFTREQAITLKVFTTDVLDEYWK